MQKGNVVKIIAGEYENRVAEIVEVFETEVTAKLWGTTEIVKLNKEDVKRKKLCVCGLSKQYPFCDGSHSGG